MIIDLGKLEKSLKKLNIDFLEVFKVDSKNLQDEVQDVEKISSDLNELINDLHNISTYEGEEFICLLIMIRAKMMRLSLKYDGLADLVQNYIVKNPFSDEL